MMDSTPRGGVLVVEGGDRVLGAFREGPAFDFFQCVHVDGSPRRSVSHLVELGLGCRVLLLTVAEPENETGRQGSEPWIVIAHGLP